MDVLDAKSAVLNLLSAAPAVIQRRLQDVEPLLRSAFRSTRDDDGYPDPRDGFSIPGHDGLVYNEHAFHYLLDLERRRAESTQRPFLLMLLEGDAADRERSAARPMTPERLLPVVRRCVRDTDFVGWYSHGAVVGAALTQDGKGATHACGIVRERMITALGNALPHQALSQLRLHLYEVVGDDERRIE